MVAIDKMLHAFLNNVPKNGGEEDSNLRPATKDEHVLPPHHGCVCDFFWHVSLDMFVQSFEIQNRKNMGWAARLCLVRAGLLAPAASWSPSAKGIDMKRAKKKILAKGIEPKTLD